MEPVRIDLKNSIVVGSVIENTKTDGSRLVLVPCMRVLTVRVRVQIQVLKICTRVKVPSTTTLAMPNNHDIIYMRYPLTGRDALIRWEDLVKQHKFPIQNVKHFENYMDRMTVSSVAEKYSLNFEVISTFIRQ